MELCGLTGKELECNLAVNLFVGKDRVSVEWEHGIAVLGKGSAVPFLRVVPNTVVTVYPIRLGWRSCVGACQDR